MIYVDANYWVYWFDSRLPEHKYVRRVMRTAVREGILLNTVTLMEVAHYFRHLQPEEFSVRVGKIQSLETLRLMGLDGELVKIALKQLARYAPVGVGGRDSVVLATMEAADVRRIASHDEVFRKVKWVEVVDPIHRSAA